MEKKYLSRDKIIGKQVIDSGAMIIGNVKDLAFDIEAKEIALTISTKTGTEVTVVSSNISTIGEVILLNKKIELPETPLTATYTPPPIKEVSTTTPPTRPGLCKICNFQNDSNAKFCIKCGARLQ